MPISVAQIWYGTTLGYGADGASAPGSFVLFLEVKKNTSPKETASKVECTHNLSPGRKREYKAGLIDPGTMEFEANYISSDFAVVRGMIGIPHWFRQTYPDGSSDTFHGYIESNVMAGGPGEIMDVKFSLQVDGDITYAPAA